jgi:hypothetical protein
MDNKLERILHKINLDEKYFNLFFNAEIKKTNIDELENSVSIEIENDNDIPYTLYNELVSKFKEFFKNGNDDEI